MVSGYAEAAAAFGRLCVETLGKRLLCNGLMKQPPSGGCVLKLNQFIGTTNEFAQPPSGGCVLKLFLLVKEGMALMQPPSGGCVLKRKDNL